MENYYEAARSWKDEVYESVYCSRYRYQLLALGLGILLLMSLIAIVTLLPLKNYYYRLITVNNQTGEVTVLKEVEKSSVPHTWVMDRYFINQYVLNRESYSHEDIKRTFNDTIALSGKEITDSYILATVDTNPESPLNTLNTAFSREVRLISINQLNENTSTARFNTITRNRLDHSNKVQQWQAILKWKYVKPSDSSAERDRNPLGFQITYYQVSPVSIEQD